MKGKRILVLLWAGFVQCDVFSGAFVRNMFTANKDKDKMKHFHI